MPRELSGIRADRGYSYQALERSAAFARRQLKFSPEAAVNGLRLFDGLDDITVGDSSGRSIQLRGFVGSLEGSEGFAKYDNERGFIEIVASQQTYEWLEQDYPRGLYFIAHELAHCVLHTDQLIRLAQAPGIEQEALHRVGKPATHEAFRDTEWQANAYASALLMPARGLRALENERGTLCPSDIAEHFGVSIEAATYRLDLFFKRRTQLL